MRRIEDLTCVGMLNSVFDKQVENQPLTKCADDPRVFLHLMVAHFLDNQCKRLFPAGSARDPWMFGADSSTC